NPNETLYTNYHAYLCDARFEIVSRTIACANWSFKYDRVSTKREANNNSTKEIKEIETLPVREQDSLVSLSTSGYDTLKNSDTSEKEPHSLNSLNEVAESHKVADQQCETNDSKDHDSLTSFGESSGYDSFRYRVDDNEDEGFAEESFRKSFVKCCDVRNDDEVPSVNWRASADSMISKFLNFITLAVTKALISKLLNFIT
ncbi:jg24376, partial [Pararge aegeria aegeria]